jgi:hypothetical protein
LRTDLTLASASRGLSVVGCPLAGLAAVFLPKEAAERFYYLARVFADCLDFAKQAFHLVKLPRHGQLSSREPCTELMGCERGLYSVILCPLHPMLLMGVYVL